MWALNDSTAHGPGTLWGIVVPNAISENFGDHDKALVLATLGTLGTIMSFVGPFTGSLSDRLPEMFPRFTARFGRRRVFFLVGQIVGVTGIYFTAEACLAAGRSVIECAPPSARAQRYMRCD
jgi:MFS family permease